METTTQAVQLHKMFKSHIKSMRYVFRDGKVAEFVGGKFHTADKKQIEELMEEIGTVGAGKSNNPAIYVDTSEAEVDPALLTPEAQLKAKLRAELIAEMAAATNKNNDMGATGLVNFASSINNSDKQEEGQISGDGATLQALKVTLNQSDKVETQQNPEAVVKSLAERLAEVKKPETPAVPAVPAAE